MGASKDGILVERLKVLVKRRGASLWKTGGNDWRHVSESLGKRLSLQVG